MKIAIIDADLIGRKKHRFPNLACMKISGYYKNSRENNSVELKLDYENLDQYDKVFISKVFTDTLIDKNILSLSNVEYGGTGFYYDKSPKLSYEIEHSFPDYHLYDDWINDQLLNGGKRLDYKYYYDYSIGFITRGCFRKCPFCVNRNCDKVEKHSSLDEFVDYSKKKILLLDDNFLGYSNWKKLLIELQNTGKPFQFKQGLDERILTDEKCELLFSSRYDGDYIFAFDNVEDYDLIEKKLQLLRRYTNKCPKFYVFCGFDRKDIWDEKFWEQDISDVFKRIELLMKYHCLPYIMRFNKYEESLYMGMYINLARWCNQPNFFKKKSFLEFCELNGQRSSSMKYLNHFKNKRSDIATKYFNMKWLDYERNIINYKKRWSM